MTAQLLGEGETIKGELSVINDPFKSDCVTDILIRYYTGFNNPHWYAKVQFQNGNTSGEQTTPDCKTFDEVIVHLKQIMQSVNVQSKQ